MAHPGTPIFVSATQINVTVPYEVGAFAQVNLVVEYQGIQSAVFPVRVSDTAPADLHAEFHRLRPSRGGESEQHLQRTALSQHHSGPTGLGDRRVRDRRRTEQPAEHYRSVTGLLDPVPDSGDDRGFESGACPRR